jgi:hypothetical protein
MIVGEITKEKTRNYLLKYEKAKEKQDSLIVYKSWRRRDGRSDADRRDASTRGLAP